MEDNIAFINSHLSFSKGPGPNAPCKTNSQINHSNRYRLFGELFEATSFKFTHSHRANAHELPESHRCTRANAHALPESHRCTRVNAHALPEKIRETKNSNTVMYNACQKRQL